MREPRRTFKSLDRESVSWLFWITLCFGLFLTFYASDRLWMQATERSSLYGLELRSVAFYLLSLISGLLGLRWAVLFLLSYATMSRGGQDALPRRDRRLPFVSILMPAFCEADCIQDAMRSLLQLDYPQYEIVFVDDGSSDNTYELALPFAGPHRSTHGRCEVKVFTKPNGGKWSAHNFGLQQASGSLILCIDADSRIDAAALRLMVRHMQDKRVGAVSGQIRVRNRNSFLGLFQSLEYVLANGALRLSQGATGSVMIVPGPIGLFRREALMRVQDENAGLNHPEYSAMPGPFSPQTFAEDFHLSLTMLSLGHRIAYEPHAIAHTKAPATLSGLLSQRYRWNRGTMQVLSWYVRRAVDGGKSPFRLKTWIATAFLFDYFCFPALYFALLGSLLFYCMNGGNLPNLASWVGASCMVNLMSGSLYAVAHRDKVILALLSPFFDLYQGILLNCAWLIAVFDQSRSARMRW